MTIKANKGLVLQSLSASSVDELIAPPTGTRWVITAFVLYNKTGSTKTVEITNDGTEIERPALAGGESKDIVEVIGQGYDAGEDISAQQVTGGAIAGDVVAKITYTEYSGDSI